DSIGVADFYTEQAARDVEDWNRDQIIGYIQQYAPVDNRYGLKPVLQGVRDFVFDEAEAAENAWDNSPLVKFYREKKALGIEEARQKARDALSLGPGASEGDEQNAVWKASGIESPGRGIRRSAANMGGDLNAFRVQTEYDAGEYGAQKVAE